MEDKENARTTIALAVEAAQAVVAVEARLERLFEIVAAQTKMEDAERARATMDTAIKHFKTAPKDDGLVSTFHNGIRKVPLEADQLTEVIALFKSPEVQNISDFALPFLALALAEEGTVSNVLEVLKAVDGNSSVRLNLRPDYRDYVLKDLISSQVEAAQFTEAIETTKLIEDLGDRISSLTRIAEAQVKTQLQAGQIAEAIETTKLIEDLGDRILPLKYSAEAQVEAGQVAEARATVGLMAEAVKASGEDSLDLIWLAQAQMKAGLVGDAKDSLRKVLRVTKFAITTGHWAHAPHSHLEGVLELLVKMHDAALL